MKAAPRIMVVLVCGSRAWTNAETIRRRLSDLPPRSVAIVGKAPGADMLAREEAARLGFEVLPVSTTQEEMFDLLWDLTTDPAERLVLAFHDDLSAPTGTAAIVAIARQRGVAVEVISDAQRSERL